MTPETLERARPRAHPPRTAPGSRAGADSPSSAGVQRPAASSAPTRREDIPPVKGGAGVVDAEPRQPLGPQAHDPRACGWRATTGASSPLSGATNRCSAALTSTMSREVPTPGSTTAMCTVPGGKVLEGPRQPEPGLGRPVNHDLVGEVDDPRRRQAAEDAALHHADEGPLVAEIRGDGDDTRGDASRSGPSAAVRRRAGCCGPSAQVRQRSA